MILIIFNDKFYVIIKPSNEKKILLIQSYALSIIISMAFVMFYLSYYLYFNFLYLTLLSVN